MTFLQKHAAKGQIVTGLLYVDPDSEDLHTHLNTVETPLNALGEQATVSGLGRARQDQRQPALAFIQPAYLTSRVLQPNRHPA